MKKCRFPKGYEGISCTYWNMIVSSAKKRNIELDIKIEDLWNLFLKQNKKCVLSNVDLILDVFYRKKRYNLKDNEYFASLDRINNKLGYNINNIRFVAREINLMKWKFTEEKFLFLIKQISNNNE
jgi:hypothetical protein